MMHLLTHQAISRGIGLYRDDQDEFDRLFPAIASDATLALWRDKLVANPPEIRVGHVVINPETTKSLISITLSDEEVTEQVMGGGNMGNGNVGSFVRETVEIRIQGTEEHTVTVLHQIVKACMYRAQYGFITAANVFQVDYEGASGLALEDEQRAEELGLYVRFVYYNFYRPDAFPLARIGQEDGIIAEINVRLEDVDTYQV